MGLTRQKCSIILYGNHKKIFRAEGELIGAPVSSSGEMVFTTGMVGYSEALTDPSYYGQILVFTYPLIGNYGFPLDSGGAIPPIGLESQKAHVSGAVLAFASTESFHWSSQSNIDEWLRSHNVPAITGIDTRELVHILRSNGKLMGRIEPENPVKELFPDHRLFDPDSFNLLPTVSTPRKTIFGKGKRRIGILDCGVKFNIVRKLIDLQCEVVLLPWDASPESVDCNGWIISNGPGDPLKAGILSQNVRKMLNVGTVPILGICLGHQILALAAGASTAKMRYGHRSHNQPVFETETDRAFITTQNHGFVVVKDSLPEDWKIWFLNANDGSVEGIRHKTRPFKSVQFHPEASAGPEDTGWIIDEFVSEVGK